MVKSIVDADFKTADSVVIGAPFGEGASFGTGAELGPAAIKGVLDEQLELFDRYTNSEPAYKYNFAYSEIEKLARTADPAEAVRLIKETLVNEQRFCVLLGGIHTVTIGALQALAEKHDPGTVTVVQLDAHFDLRDDDSEYNEDTPSTLAHSTVMRRAYDYGFNILPIGVRTMFVDEYNFVQDKNISYFEWGRADVPIPTIQEILATISTDKIYLTLDIDGLDPAVAPATGTPIPEGISLRFAENLLQQLARYKTIVGADIVEVAPVEHSALTEYTAALLTYRLLADNSRNL